MILRATLFPKMVDSFHVLLLFWASKADLHSSGIWLHFFISGMFVICLLQQYCVLTYEASSDFCESHNQKQHEVRIVYLKTSNAQRLKGPDNNQFGPPDPSDEFRNYFECEQVPRCLLVSPTVCWTAAVEISSAIVPIKGRKYKWMLMLRWMQLSVEVVFPFLPEQKHCRVDRQNDWSSHLLVSFWIIPGNWLPDCPTFIRRWL